MTDSFRPLRLDHYLLATALTWLQRYVTCQTTDPTKWSTNEWRKLTIFGKWILSCVRWIQSIPLHRILNSVPFSTGLTLRGVAFFTPGCARNENSHLHPALDSSHGCHQISCMCVRQSLTRPTNFMDTVKASSVYVPSMALLLSSVYKTYKIYHPNRIGNRRIITYTVRWSRVLKSSWPTCSKKRHIEACQIIVVLFR
jgi:hypothetical protein